MRIKMPKKSKNTIWLSDNLPILKKMKSESVDLIYIDPPFNTGKKRRLDSLKTTRDDIHGNRIGFGDKLYRATRVSSREFEDSFTDYMDFLCPRLLEAYRILTPTGSLFLHIDYREVHHCRILLDWIFGSECFMNEIIWHWDYGAKSKKRWSCKHNNILYYVKDPKNYTFNYDVIDRIPYMAPGLVGKKKAERGKIPTDSWFITIVPTHSKERTGYPTQKPLKLLERIVKVHSNPGETILDFFAGTGTAGEAAALLNRRFLLVDDNVEAYNIMIKRLKKFSPRFPRGL